MKPDVPANRLFAGPWVRRQDFQNLSPLILLRVGSVNHRICVRDHLDHVLTTRTANPDPGMLSPPAFWADGESRVGTRPRNRATISYASKDYGGARRALSLPARPRNSSGSVARDLR